MAQIIAIVVALIAGLVIGWLCASIRTSAARARGAELDRQLAELKQASAAQDGQLTEARQSLARDDERLRAFEKAEEKMAGTFKVLAADTLKGSTDQFLKLAGERFDGARKQVENLITPASKSLQELNDKLQEVEKDRSGEASALREQLSRLDEQTRMLANALKTPHVVGQWGEVQLRKVVEIAGMTEYCDFDEQTSVTTEGATLRPDMRVRLPGGKNVVVDSKAPLQAYLRAMETTDEQTRALGMREHARQVREHVDKLSSKSYWDACRPTPELVVLFLPGEMFFSAALQADSSLIEYAALKKVILATPTTLIALLKAVFYGWRQERLAENAERISEIGRQLHERLAIMFGHFAQVGRNLSSSVEAYNKTVGSLEGRVMPAARKFEELGVSSKGAIVDLDPIDSAARQLDPPASNPDAPGDEGQGTWADTETPEGS